MGRNPFNIGTEHKKSSEENLITSIFYFMREFKINPLDEMYRINIIWVDWFWKIKRPIIEVVKQGITIPMFNAMMKELQTHYKREAEANKKHTRKR